MKEKHLTTDTAPRTIDGMQNTTCGNAFLSRLFPVSCQMSVVSCSRTRGYTIVEMIVALGIFTIVLFMASSAFLSIVNADRKSRATRIGMDNLNLALEDMSRKIKTGTVYRCSDGNGTGDCSLFGKYWNDRFSFFDQKGQRITYKRAQGPFPVSVGGCGDALYTGSRGCILRLVGSIETNQFMLATSPEIDIKELKFWVSGSTPSPGDTKQPTVTISIWGSVGSSADTAAEKSAFRIQTTVTQRAYDN